MNPFTRKLRTPERIREELHAAGWKPSMVGYPITDEKIRSLLLELNTANAARTMKILRTR